MCPAQQDRPNDSVLGKTFAILESFRVDDRGVTLGEVGKRTGLAKSTIHRLLRELKEYGVIETTDNGRYVPGLRLFELARLVPMATDLRETALPFIEDLYEATHETVHLGILDGTEVVYIEKIAGHRISAVQTRVGGRMPAYCTGLGKAMLAYSPPEVLEAVLSGGLVPLTRFTITVPAVLGEELKKIAESGIAYDREESRAGLVCVAAPVFGVGNRLLASISVSGTTSRANPDALGPAVRATSLALSRALRLAGVSRVGAAARINDWG
jgi:DNA-binding IclR family transcriptional regulator